MKIPFPKYEAEVVAEIEAYLDMDYQTEITHEEVIEDTGLKISRARGYDPNGRGDLSTCNENNYARPMFQVIGNRAFSGRGLSVTPCTACDRFDRSWACSEHTEIPWDEKKRRWVRPGVEDQVTAYYYDHPGDGGGFLFNLDRVPDGLMGPTRLDLQARLADLPSFSMTFEGTFDPTFLEITGETVQGTTDAVRIEVESDDDTTA